MGIMSHGTPMLRNGTYMYVCCGDAAVRCLRRPFISFASRIKRGGAASACAVAEPRRHVCSSSHRTKISPYRQTLERVVVT